MAKMKDIVKDSYLHIIKGTLNRLAHGDIEGILNHLIKLHLTKPSDSDQTLIITDKFHAYRELWKAILETLYEKYLPHYQYKFEWRLELTPYTVMLCNWTKEVACDDELELLLSQTGITLDEIEQDFPSVDEKIGLTRMGLSYFLEERLPPELLPNELTDRFRLLLRLMNFPPLEELARFHGQYRSHINHQFNSLGVAFPGYERAKLEEMAMNESLHYSYFHFKHAVLSEQGIDRLIDHSELADFKTQLEEIRLYASSAKDSYQDEITCPCCGEKQALRLPEELLHYRGILLNKKLSKRIGFLHFNTFEEDFRKSLANRIRGFIDQINIVDQPECLIMVEGESEEVALPILAFRTRFILSEHLIQVYNSKSKQKLREDFFNFKVKYPNRKIIVLLDADATKERDDIQRVIKDRMNRYRLFFIEEGTFEDLFALDESIRVLNEIYPLGEPILGEDFDPSKDFLSNVSRLLFQKKKATFDKVLFARHLSYQMDITTMPELLKQILKVAQDFTSPGKFIKT